MLNTVTVNGSHGSLLVHFESGHIIAAEACDCTDCARFGDYTTIAWFDPARWDECARKYGCADILLTAFVDKQGRYQRECSVVTCGDADLPDYYLDEVPLLPAPEPVAGSQVIVHAWQWTEPDWRGRQYQEYATPGLDRVDGWCVYLRTPSPDGDWDGREEEDFPDRASAVAAAEVLAAVYGAIVCVED